MARQSEPLTIISSSALFGAGVFSSNSSSFIELIIFLSSRNHSYVDKTADKKTNSSS
jgi:hypothetical protein